LFVCFFFAVASAVQKETTLTKVHTSVSLALKVRHPFTMEQGNVCDKDMLKKLHVHESVCTCCVLVHLFI